MVFIAVPLLLSILYFALQLGDWNILCPVLFFFCVWPVNEQVDGVNRLSHLSIKLQHGSG